MYKKKSAAGASFTLERPPRSTRRVCSVLTLLYVYDGMLVPVIVRKRKRFKYRLDGTINLSVLNVFSRTLQDSASLDVITWHRPMERQGWVIPGGSSQRVRVSTDLQTTAAR